jgi:hypothetical protein
MSIWCYADMADATELTVVSMGSGQVTTGPRAGVGAEQIQQAKRALGGGGGLGQGWSVRRRSAPLGCWLFELDWERLAFCRCFLCADAVLAEVLWEAAEQAQLQPPLLRAPRPDQVPWLAIAALPGARTLVKAKPALLQQMGPRQCQVAWALLTP